jgi:signal transduction histidine kinase
MKKSFWRGSTLHSLILIIIPLTFLLVVISFLSFFSHQNALRTLVEQRDEYSARSAANSIESEIDYRLFAIQSLALMARSNTEQNPGAILSATQSLMGDFDYGMAIYNHSGSLLTTSGQGPFWQSLSGTSELASALNSTLPDSLSSVFNAPSPDNKQAMLVSAPIGKNDWVAVGAFSPELLIQPLLKGIYPANGDTAIYVIGANSQIIFHSGANTSKGVPQAQPAVTAGLRGQSGTIYMEIGAVENVVAYSPIPKADWAIITEESWEKASSPYIKTWQIIPLILLPALLLATLALWFGNRQIVRPLRDLESKAAKLSWGDFKQIEEPVGGIAEIQGLQNELAHMAHQLQAAQDSLHSYIAAITKGQEDERLRLARELHDDTIQSLIALKQRVQLAHMPPKKNGSTPEPADLETLIEGTIEDLRRTTRALRPIYLEELGIKATLEMLSRETSLKDGLSVDFRVSGVEKRLPAETELALYRMVQEALNNIIHHAHAKHTSVQLRFSQAALTVEILDDGIGFKVPRTPAEFTPEGHFGLLGLYERAELIGAQLQINSSPKTGTHLRIFLPYATSVPVDGTKTKPSRSRKVRV